MSSNIMQFQYSFGRCKIFLGLIDVAYFTLLQQWSTCECVSFIGKWNRLNNSLRIYKLLRPLLLWKVEFWRRPLDLLMKKLESWSRELAISIDMWKIWLCSIAVGIMTMSLIVVKESNQAITNLWCQKYCVVCCTTVWCLLYHCLLSVIALYSHHIWPILRKIIVAPPW